MAKLIFLLDGNVIKEYAVDKDRLTIGRRATNDVHIDNLAISGEHAVIVSAGDEVYIEDLNSTNGTVVNKKVIKKQALKHGDTIGLGKYQLKFVQDLTATKKLESNGFADTVMMTPAKILEEDSLEQNAASEETTTDLETDETAELAEEAKEPRLKILTGDRSGELLFLDKTMVKLGEAGKQVAVVTKRQDGFFLTHVAGNQYPMVNGKTIGAQAHALTNHEEIEVLGIKMEFCLD
ncbi:MAG: FHA domain-containing protein [Methylotenera sp.]|jgi:pSer/pThr/pTyr-binding forkhead associated (FHA) protein